MDTVESEPPKPIEMAPSRRGGFHVGPRAMKIFIWGRGNPHGSEAVGGPRDYQNEEEFSHHNHVIASLRRQIPLNATTISTYMAIKFRGAPIPRESTLHLVARVTKDGIITLVNPVMENDKHHKALSGLTFVAGHRMIRLDGVISPDGRVFCSDSFINRTRYLPKAWSRKVLGWRLQRWINRSLGV